MNQLVHLRLGAIQLDLLGVRPDDDRYREDREAPHEEAQA